MGNSEDMASLHPQRASCHLFGGHPAGPSGADQRSHARPHDEIGYESPFLKSAKHPNMGETLKAASAQNQGKLGRLFHLLASTEYPALTFAIPVPEGDRHATMPKFAVL